MVDFVTLEQLEAALVNLRKMIGARALGLYWQTPVEDKDLVEPPTNPAKGIRYLIPISGPTTELDYFEYASNAEAQAVYVTSGATVDIIDQSQLSGNDYAPVYGDGSVLEKYAQEFQVSENLSCPKITVKLQKFNSPTDDIVIRIETDSGGFPSGNLVDANATSSMAASSVSTTPTLYDFTFPAPIPLNVGSIYHLVVQRSGARDANHYINVYVNISGGYANGEAERKDSGVWSNTTWDLIFKIYKRIPALQCYSEAVVKQQGAYSLKGVAYQISSLNEYLERTIGSPIDLSDQNTIKFNIRASRTGSNIKIGIRDAGGTWTENTPNIAIADIWQLVEWDISGVANVDKDAIDRIRITVVNADIDNVFYIDNMFVSGTGLAGDWVGHGNEITTYDGNRWMFVSPKEGMLVYVKDEDKFYVYIAAWQMTAII